MKTRTAWSNQKKSPKEKFSLVTSNKIPKSLEISLREWRFLKKKFFLTRYLNYLHLASWPPRRTDNIGKSRGLAQAKRFNYIEPALGISIQ